MVRKQLDDAGTSWRRSISNCTCNCETRSSQRESRRSLVLWQPDGRQRMCRSEWRGARQQPVFARHSAAVHGAQACSGSRVQTSTGTCSAPCGGGVQSVEYACEIWWCPSQRKCSRYIVLLRTREKGYEVVQHHTATVMTTMQHGELLHRLRQRLPMTAANSPAILDRGGRENARFRLVCTCLPSHQQGSVCSSTLACTQDCFRRRQQQQQQLQTRHRGGTVRSERSGEKC